MKQTILRHYKAQARAARGVPLRITPKDPLKKVFAASSEVMDAVLGNFKDQTVMTGSWIADQPIPLQLLKQQRLTLDLTLAQLGAERPYNLDMDSLTHLAKNRLLLLNFRDVDSEMRKDFSGITGKVQDNLGRLYDEAPDSIYYGSALREVVFNAISGADDADYARHQREAYAALGPAHACFGRYHEAIKDEIEITFRREKPSLDAVSWHWAYLNAIAPKIQDRHSHIMEAGYGTGRARTLYHNAAQQGREATFPTENREKGIRAAKTFAELHILLRMCHLNFTAPITASFGATYNMTDKEFLQAKHLNIGGTTSAPLPDAEHLEYLQYLYDILMSPTLTEELHAHAARHLPEPLLAYDADALWNYSPDNVKRFTDAVLRSGEDIAKAYAQLPDFLRQMHTEGIDSRRESWDREYQEALEALEEYNSQKNQIQRGNIVNAWNGISLAVDVALRAGQAISLGTCPLLSPQAWKLMDLLIRMGIDLHQSKVWDKMSHESLYCIHKQLAPQRTPDQIRPPQATTPDTLLSLLD